MSYLVESDSDTWKASHDFGISPILNMKLRFANSTSVFSVESKLHSRLNACYMTITSTDSPITYTIEYKMSNHGLSSIEGTLTETKTDSYTLTCTPECVISIELKLTNSAPALNTAPVAGSFSPSKAELNSYIEEGPNVTLVGSNGNVTVSRRILKLRSRALRAMFSHDSIEKQTGQIELKDFDAKTLKAFGHFMMTDEIDDGKDTALGLILLGDKYDIQTMKSVAEEFVKKNIGKMNKEDALDILSKVSRDLLYDGIVALSKK